MPTYDYKCTKCEYTEEVFHSMDDKPKIKCPECSAPMSKSFTSGPYLHPSAVPTRKNNSGVSSHLRKAKLH